MKTSKQKLKRYINKTKKNKNIKNIKSFSPSINKKLDITSLISHNMNSLSICKSLLKIKINNTCYNYDDKKTTNYLLSNLKYSKHLNVENFIAPKQLMANCWFNTMFVTFFFSDKGRKFFRFFRNLMITGKKYDNTYIENTDIRKLLFVLNLFIEASYNQSDSELYSELNNLTNNLNTNFFIKEIYSKISDKNLENSIPNIKDAGNPLIYYKTIMSYLNYNIIKILNINITNKLDILKILKFKFNNVKEIPDMIIIEDFESNSKFDLEYKFNIKNEKYIYKLDAIIITNKDHFDKNANSHFVSVATINKKEYKFDGSSYSKLSQFKWKKLINKNKDWTFKENHNYYPEKYNFTKGYKLLFYYRV